MVARFNIYDPRTGAAIFEGIDEHNAYIAWYPAPVGKDKHPRALDPGESSLCKYNLGGTTGTYRVYRLPDEET